MAKLARPGNQGKEKLLQPGWHLAVMSVSPNLTVILCTWVYNLLHLCISSMGIGSANGHCTASQDSDMRGN